jgi:two-component system CheB/CheR fusion protein
VVFIQHLDPHHESMLSQILSRNTQIAVSEATDQTAVEPNHIYIIPANADLSIEHGVLQVGARKPGHMVVDSFFRALAEDRPDDADADRRCPLRWRRGIREPELCADPTAP